MKDHARNGLEDTQGGGGWGYVLWIGVWKGKKEGRIGRLTCVGEGPRRRIREMLRWKGATLSNSWAAFDKYLILLFWNSIPCQIFYWFVSSFTPPQIMCSLLIFYLPAVEVEALNWITFVINAWNMLYKIPLHKEWHLLLILFVFSWICRFRTAYSSPNNAFFIDLYLPPVEVEALNWIFFLIFAWNMFHKISLHKEWYFMFVLDFLFVVLGVQPFLNLYLWFQRGWILSKYSYDSLS